jgi:hypothetical protein
MHTGIQAYRHTYTHTQTYIHIPNLLGEVLKLSEWLTYMYTGIQAYRHTYIHTQTCIHTHTKLVR